MKRKTNEKETTETTVLFELSLTQDMGFFQNKHEAFLQNEEWYPVDPEDSGGEECLVAEDRVNYLPKAATVVFLDHEALIPSYKLRLLKNALKKKLKEREKLDDDISSIETLMDTLRK